MREVELCEECQRREEDLAKCEEESRKQMLLLQALVEGVKKQGEAAVRKAESDKDVKDDQLKSAILRHYDITEESCRQRFRAAKLRPGESNLELAAKREDLAGKWMKTCTSIEELRDLVVLEKLLNTLPEDARIFVKQR